MFFASRYSVMIGLMYRSAIARHTHVINETVVPGGTGTVSAEPSPTPGIPLDTGAWGYAWDSASGSRSRSRPDRPQSRRLSASGMR